MNTIRHINSGAQPPFGERGEQTATSQLDDLARLRAAAMAMAERLAAPDDVSVSASAPTPAATIEQRALAFTRVARAVRQIIVLEQEVLGLRAYSPRQFASAQAQPSERPLDLADLIAAMNEEYDDNGEPRSGRGDRDDVREPVDVRDRPDLRDANDLRDPDDLDDYDDIVMDDGDAALTVAVRSMQSAAPSASGTASAPDDESSSAMQPVSSSVTPHSENSSDGFGAHGRPTASSAMPHVYIRRRAMRSHGPPDG